MLNAVAHNAGEKAKHTKNDDDAQGKYEIPRIGRYQLSQLNGR